MDNYSLSTKMSWSQTMSDLAHTFEMWDINSWDTNYPRGARLTGYNQEIEDRRVILTYNKDGKNVKLVMDKQARAVDNLRVLYLAVEAMRMNEKRGIGDIIKSAYLQLEAPTPKRDPYEILEIRQGASLEIAEAAFRTKARQEHPDLGGTMERMKELNEAIEIIRKERQNEN